jgi:hypothetical protein
MKVREISQATFLALVAVFFAIRLLQSPAEWMVKAIGVSVCAVLFVWMVDYIIYLWKGGKPC